MKDLAARQLEFTFCSASVDGGSCLGVAPASASAALQNAGWPLP